MKIELNKLNNERGSIILMAIFLAFFITTLMITLEMFRLSDTEIITNQIKDMEAYYCAESGIEYYKYLSRRFAMFYPSRADAAFDTTYPLTACTTGGAIASTRTYQVRLQTTKIDLNMTFYNYIHITSTGTTLDYSRRVKASMRRPWQGRNFNDLRYMHVRRWREL